MRQKTAQFVDNLKKVPSAILNLRLLGTYEVKLGEQPLADLGSRKAYALLFYLAVIGKPVARATLATLLWPEMPEDAAKNNLRTTLTSIKKYLAPYLEITRARVNFNRTCPYQLDVDTLSACLDSGTAKQDINELQRAVRIYRDEFLHGFSVKEAEPFEEWLLQQREQFHLRILHALETLLVLCLEQKAYMAGLAAGRRLLELEPWSETAHRHLMILLAKSGQRTSALAQYERCRAILADELGMEPMPETTALYQQIRSGEYSATVAGNSSSVMASKALPGADQQQDPVNNTPSPIPHNVPTALTKLSGYGEELACIQQQLSKEPCRLLTLVGMGGVGKTHLALAAARQIVNGASGAKRFGDGVYFIPLDGVREKSSSEAAGQAIASAIAETLGYTFRGDSSPQVQLQRYLATKQMLLILDNMEHLSAGALFIAALLQQASQLAILVTSREKLKLRGEQVLGLSGLLPQATQLQRSQSTVGNRAIKQKVTSDGALIAIDKEPLMVGDMPLRQTNDAVALFVYHAQMANHHFVADVDNVAHIMRICELVDGLPLGIEMAAKWLEIMDCAAIVDEISRNLDFLEATQHDVPLRHQTLRAVFNHSWALLSSSQQTLLAHLSIFQSSFPPAAAMAVTGASLLDLSSLVSKSLLGRNVDGHLTMHHSIRHFTREQLFQNEEEQQTIEARYATYYLDLATQHWHSIISPKWRERGAALLNDIDNVKAALQLAVEREMWAEIYAAYPTLSHLEDLQGWFLESLALWRAIERRLTARTSSGSTTEQQRLEVFRGELFKWQGWCESRLGRFAAATTAYLQSISILRQVTADLEAAFHPDGGKDEAELLIEARDALGHVFTIFSHAKNWMGESLAAREMLQEAQGLVTRPDRLPTYFYVRAYAMYQLGEYAEAHSYALKGLRLAEQLGDPRLITSLQIEVGRVEQAEGNYAVAEQFFLQSYEQKVKVGDHGGIMQTSLLTLGTIARLLGKYDVAKSYLQRNLAHAMELELTAVLLQIHWALGDLALQQDDYRTAKAQYLESRYHPAFRLLAVGLPTLGWAHIGLAEFAEAEAYFQEVIQAAQPVRAYRQLLEALGGLIVLFALVEEFSQPHEQLAQVENHPATTKETKDRIRKMVRQIKEASSALKGGPAHKPYSPSPELQRTVAVMLAGLSHH